MIAFEKSVEYIRGRSLTITSWHDDETDTWKAHAPGLILPPGRVNRPGQASRKDAISQIMREMEQSFQRESAGSPEGVAADRPRGTRKFRAE